MPRAVPAARLIAITLAVAAALVASAARAQTPPARPTPPDTTRPTRPAPVDTARARLDSLRAAGDSARAAADTARPLAGPRRPRAVVQSPIVRPPISPRRAFLYSLALPGFGQARLERPSAGALFVAIEATALVMARKALGDLREAKRFQRDSLVPGNFPVDSTIAPVRPPQERVENLFTASLVRSRRLHLEDWIAVLVFNHLFAGAEAFVSANLWDLPTQVSARRGERGPVLAVEVTW